MVRNEGDGNGMAGSLAKWSLTRKPFPCICAVELLHWLFLHPAFHLFAFYFVRGLQRKSGRKCSFSLLLSFRQSVFGESTGVLLVSYCKSYKIECTTDEFPLNLYNLKCTSIGLGNTTVQLSSIYCI